MTTRQKAALAGVVKELHRISEELRTAEARGREKYAQESHRDQLPLLLGVLSFHAEHGAIEIARLVRELEGAFSSLLAAAKREAA